MPAHKIQVTLDEKADTLVVRHYTTLDAAGHEVTSHEVVPIDAKAGDALKSYLRGMIDANRKAMESHAADAAIVHVAEVTKKGRRGKSLQLTGDVAAIGAAEQNKADKG